MKAFIIDNEKSIITGLEQLLKLYCPEIQEIKTAQNIDDAHRKMTNYQPDILFLDVELDTCTGMDFLDSLDHVSFEVIFITAYDQYAIKAIKYEAVDYLLKPIDPDDLVSAVAKAKRSIDMKRDHRQLQKVLSTLSKLESQDKHLVVADKESIYKIKTEDIIYLEADGPYTKIVKSDESLFVTKNLKQFEELLIAAGFFRTHHSFLANLNKMTKYEKSYNTLELCGEYKVPVSVRKKEGLLEQIRKSS